MLLTEDFERGVKVGKTTPDGVFMRCGVRLCVEVDNGSMTAKQMRRKWLRYGKVDGYILVICHSEERLRRLMRGAERVQDVTIFTTFDWLKSQEEPWIDRTGVRVKL